MTFVARIVERLEACASQAVVTVASADGRRVVTGGELIAAAAAMRARLRGAGLAKGDRVALVAGNDAAWVAADLACLAEGFVTVPLYARGGPDEIAFVLRETTPAIVLAGDAALQGAIAPLAAGARVLLLEDGAGVGGAAPGSRGASPAPAFAPIVPLAPNDLVTIRTTSGTSGEPKGVVLTCANLDHMLGCTSARLGVLLAGLRERERIFHYLPFCFAGSWILLLTALVRGADLTVGTDPSRIAADLAASRPHAYLNVPLLLERIRSGIEEKLRARGGAIAVLFAAARAAALRRADGRARPGDAALLSIARPLLLAPIRKKLGPDLRALLCGSAPLARETQLFFEMLGLPVLQIYGLTETTAICTMDQPGRVAAGRVGSAVEGVEMKLSEAGEILVRGPNVFAGYWNRPEATAAAFADGWFRTGDTGDADDAGRWQIHGRVKNVLVLSSGHNVAPEPLEDRLRASLPEARHVVVVGHGRPHVAALVAGGLGDADVRRAIDDANALLPHYQRIHRYAILPDATALEGRCFTANGKLRRDAVARELAATIDTLYAGAGQ